MKKVLSLVLALALVLGSFAPVFAAENEYAAEGAKLQELGVLAGDGNGLNLDGELTRAELYTLVSRLMDQEETAKTYPVKGNIIFDDVNEGDWYDGIVGWAFGNGLTKGMGNGTFAPNDVVPAQQLQALMLRVLGYTDVEWDDVPATATEKGIMGDIVPSGNSTRGLMSALVLNTLKTETATGTILAIDLGFDDLVVVVPPVVDGDLAIESITATSLIQIVVDFNMDVEDNEEAADKSNYEVDLETVDSVSVDGSAVTITLDDGVENQADAILTIAEDVFGEEVEAEFRFFDQDLPEVEGITVNGPKSLAIEFSEPIATKGTVTIKTGTSTLSVNSTNITGIGTKVITVPLYSTLVDGKTYNVNVKGFADYAVYNNITSTVAVEYVEDVNPPVATITEATQEYVKVEFNKPVTGLTKDHFSHTFTAWKSIKITGDDDFTSASLAKSDKVEEVYVWFYGDDSNLERPIAEGSTSFRILTKADDSTIKDLWSNEFASETLTLSVVSDKAAPSIVEIIVTDEDAFTIEFSKNVVFDEDNIEITDTDGDEIGNVDVEVTGPVEKVYTINLGTSLANETILVTIKDVEDTTLLANEMKPYSTALDISDQTAPKVEMVTYDTTEQMLYVFFDEEVTSETALIAGNYFLVNGTSYTKLSKAPEFFNNSRTVMIELTNAQHALMNLSSTGTKVFVTGVLDVDENEIAKNLTEVIANQNDNTPAMDEAIATSTDTVQITFTQELAEVEIDAFLVNGFAPIAMEVTMDGAKTVVTLTLDPAHLLAYDDSAIRVTYADTAIVGSTDTNEEYKLIENLFGVNPLSGEFAVIEDQISPELTYDSNDDAIITRTGDIITLAFTEGITFKSAALAAADLVIEDEDGNQLLATSDYETVANSVYVNISLLSTGDYVDYAGTLTVSTVDEVNYIFDANVNENTLVAFEDITVDLGTVEALTLATTLEGTATTSAGLAVTDAEIATAQANIDAAQVAHDYAERLDIADTAVDNTAALATIQTAIDAAQAIIDAL